MTPTTASDRACDDVLDSGFMVTNGWVCQELCVNVKTVNIQTRWLAGSREWESGRVGEREIESLTLSPEPPIHFTRKQLYPAQNRMTHLPK